MLNGVLQIAKHGFMIVLLAALARNAIGTSISAVSVSEMTEQSEFIFEGYVTGIRTDKDPNSAVIRTYVTFEVLDVLKGDYPTNTVEISFLGGKIGDVTMTVDGMHIPKAGEKGVYFVESLKRRQVHPLYGWSQGHFVVVSDEQGEQRVLTQSALPVTAVSARPIERKVELSDGIAKGLTVLEVQESRGAMTLKQFKSEIRKQVTSLQ